MNPTRFLPTRFLQSWAATVVILKFKIKIQMMQTKNPKSQSDRCTTYKLLHYSVCYIYSFIPLFPHFKKL
jgi:hypothetical protein